MAPEVTRKLAAILTADVAGYSRLMSEDEEGTLRRLDSYRKVIERVVEEHDGRVFGSAGDSVMVEFASSVQAVRGAVRIQEECATPSFPRIGAYGCASESTSAISWSRTTTYSVTASTSPPGCRLSPSPALYLHLR